MARSRYRLYRAVHPFDERFGIDTGELIYELPGGGNSRGSNNGYCATPPSVFHQLVERLHLNCSSFTFLDLGSGKGRTLLLALRYGFRKIIGVEISTRLDRIARLNIRRFAAADSGLAAAAVDSIQCIRTDVSEFAFPGGPLLIYMWNAFTEPVLDRVTENLRKSFLDQPREVYLLYMDPDLEGKLTMLPWIERLWSDEFELSAEDYDAWPFPDHTELCSAYRLVSPLNCFRNSSVKSNQRADRSL